MPQTDSPHAAALQEIRRRLADYYTPAETEQWLNAPHLLLANEIPLNLVNAGQADRVTRLLDQLDSGVYL